MWRVERVGEPHSAKGRSAARQPVLKQPRGHARAKQSSCGTHQCALNHRRYTRRHFLCPLLQGMQHCRRQHECEALAARRSQHHPADSEQQRRWGQAGELSPAKPERCMQVAGCMRLLALSSMGEWLCSNPPVSEGAPPADIDDDNVVRTRLCMGGKVRHWEGKR